MRAQCIWNSQLPPNARPRIAATTGTSECLSRRLVAWKFTVIASKGLGYERLPEGAVNDDVLHKLGVETYEAAGHADALVMSCGGLHTLDVIVPLERSIGVPVVSSTPHGLWHCARMLNLDARIQGFGMVMAA